MLHVLPNKIRENRRTVLSRLWGTCRRCGTRVVPVWQVVERAASTRSGAKKRSTTGDVGWLHVAK